MAATDLAAPAVLPTVAGRNSRLTRQRTRAAWLFVAPMLLVLAAVAGWPLLRTIWFAFTDANLADLSATQFVGFDQLRLSADRPRLVGCRPQHDGVHRRLGRRSRPSWASASPWR